MTTTTTHVTLEEAMKRQIAERDAARAAAAASDPFDDREDCDRDGGDNVKWAPCEGGWECFLPDPFVPNKVVRFFRRRI